MLMLYLQIRWIRVNVNVSSREARNIYYAMSESVCLSVYLSVCHTREPCLNRSSHTIENVSRLLRVDQISASRI